ncbi:MAG: hypothetical protein EOO25_16310, partial [Comamonadaceae bacterium]
MNWPRMPNASRRTPSPALALRPQLLASAITLAFCAPAALAQPATGGATTGSPAYTSQRLSAWLLQQKLPDDAYLPGLSWMAASELVTQAAMKRALRTHLMGSDQTAEAAPDARLRLSEWIATLPVTGRVPVSVADARYLETRPAEDPVLGDDHRISVPARPTTVTVVTSDGRLCAVPHLAGHTARGYLSACRTPALNRPVDRVWLAQPDGRVQNFGIAGWNAEAQGEPAPGAWIWAPEQGSGWGDDFSARLIEFLATQGPAPDSTAERPQARLAPAPRPEPSPYSLDGLLGSFTGSPPLRDRAVIGGDWGGIGLLQTPTARMSPAGDISVSYSRAYPFWNLNVTLQPLDWMEVSYRYSSVNEELYGPAIAGNLNFNYFRGPTALFGGVQIQTPWEPFVVKLEYE